MSFRRLLPTVLAFFMLAACDVKAAPSASPSAFIDNLGQEVIGVLKDDALDQKAREARFQTLMEQTVDTETTARTVLGRYWNVATEEQRTEFRDVYRKYLLRLYATRFAAFQGQTFTVKGARGGAGSDAVVDTTINPPPTGGPTYSVSWRVRDNAGDYRIVDVMTEGVSILVTHNQEFASVIQNNGGKVQALIDALKKRVGTSS